MITHSRRTPYPNIDVARLTATVSWCVPPCAAFEGENDDVAAVHEDVRTHLQRYGGHDWMGGRNENPQGRVVFWSDGTPPPPDQASVHFGEDIRIQYYIRTYAYKMADDRFRGATYVFRCIAAPWSSAAAIDGDQFRGFVYHNNFRVSAFGRFAGELNDPTPPIPVHRADKGEHSHYEAAVRRLGVLYELLDQVPFDLADRVLAHEGIDAATELAAVRLAGQDQRRQLQEITNILISNIADETVRGVLGMKR